VKESTGPEALWLCLRSSHVRFQLIKVAESVEKLDDNKLGEADHLFFAGLVLL
jgi:hypothetical protein